MTLRPTAFISLNTTSRHDRELLVDVGEVGEELWLGDEEHSVFCSSVAGNYWCRRVLPPPVPQ